MRLSKSAKVKRENKEEDKEKTFYSIFIQEFIL